MLHVNNAIRICQCIMHLLRTPKTTSSGFLTLCQHFQFYASLTTKLQQIADERVVCR